MLFSPGISLTKDHISLLLGPSLPPGVKILPDADNNNGDKVVYVF